MKILVLGFTRSGKTTVAEIISDITGLVCANTSDAIINEYALEHDLNYHTIIKNKDQYRERIFKFARQRQTQDPLWPQEIQLRTCSILTGLRNRDELKAASAYNLYGKVLWVDRDGVTKSKTDDIDINIVKEYFNDVVIVSNNSTKEDLTKLLKLLIPKMFD